MRGEVAISLLVCLILGIGFIFLCVAGILMYSGKKKERNCSVHTVGTVVDNIYSSYSKDAQRTWHPVFEYSANGKPHRKRSNYGTAKPLFEIGQRVAIRYNPDAPDEYLVEDMAVGKTLQMVFLWVAFGLLLLGTILLFVFV